MPSDSILIVDDNPANLKLARVLLSLEGYEIRTALDAEQALKLLETYQPNLILNIGGHGDVRRRAVRSTLGRGSMRSHQAPATRRDRGGHRLARRRRRRADPALAIDA
jgi:DNA-binding NarL/FixJ family response regulator